MSTDRVVQPLVACLGNPVAGNPTQFVMSRIARDAELDWRFFTSEVALDQFEAAFRGVKALGMAGMAILDPFQEQAVGFLDSVSEGVSRWGRVSVARRDGNAWIGENTLGAGLIHSLRTKLSVPPQREDGTMSPQSIAVWGPSQTAHAIHGLLPTLDGDFATLLCVGKSENMESRAANDAEQPAKSDVRAVGLEEMASLERPVRVLVLDFPASQRFTRPKTMAKWFQQIAWATAPVVVCTHGREQLDEESLEWLQGRDATIVEELELMAHRAAVDFHFWTGVEPSIELIREALVEYLQW
jgi:shikimate dehydrogenase